MEIINILIYILACFGLFVTMATIIESYKNDIPCEIIKKKNCSGKILIKIKKGDYNQTTELIERLKNGEFNNIYEIAEDVKIMKYN